MKLLLYTIAPLMALVLHGQTPPVQSPASRPQPAGTPSTATVAPDAVILKIGSESLTRADFENLIASLPERVRAEVTGPNRRKLAEQLIELKVAAQEARRRKIDQTPQVKQQLALQSENLLAGALYKDVLDNIKPNDTALKEYYESHKSEYQQAKGRHILVRFQGSRVPMRPNQKDLTEAEALVRATDLRKRLAAGEDFATVAKAESDDTGSGANGGDLGTFSRGQMVPQFEEVAFATPAGKISDPVKSPFGYHIIEIQQQLNKSFDDVKVEIESKIKPDLAKKQMEDLKKAVTVTIDDAYFK